jgi:hypothetical protein
MTNSSSVPHLGGRRRINNGVSDPNLFSGFYGVDKVTELERNFKPYSRVHRI